MAAPTHYEVLGVPRTATADELRAAYRAAARDHHPDAGGDARRMRELNAAWRVLGDPVRRAAYDRALAAGPGGPARHGRGPWSATGTDDRPGTADDLGFDPDSRWPGTDRWSAQDWADLVDTRPIGETRALDGWWALLPPGTFVASVALLAGAMLFLSPVLLAASAGAFILSIGLFVLAPLRAMTRRPPPPGADRPGGGDGGGAERPGGGG